MIRRREIQRKLALIALCALVWTIKGSEPVFAAVPADPETVGESCSGEDSSRICLGLKYVVYGEGEQGVVNQAQAIQNLQEINGVWKQCGIQFQIDQFEVLDPRDLKEKRLAFNTSNYTELDDIRSRLSDEKSLLVVTTGPWNRTGSLGTTTANAWTSLPGSGPFGVVMEKKVATFANIIAHELGHYLNLRHQNDVADLMNPIIYAKSKAIPAAQCATARQSAKEHWQFARR